MLAKVIELFKDPAHGYTDPEDRELVLENHAQEGREIHAWSQPYNRVPWWEFQVWRSPRGTFGFGFDFNHENYPLESSYYHESNHNLIITLGVWYVLVKRTTHGVKQYAPRA